MCAYVCVCVTSILGEYRGRDPVTDPHLTGYDRISPQWHAHINIYAHKHTNKHIMGVLFP